MWITQTQALVDITTGKPATLPAPKTFLQDEEFVASALTTVGDKEYRIADYSFKKGIFNGVPTTSLTLTAPGVPNIPPVTTPILPEPDRAAVIVFLLGLMKSIGDFLAKFSIKK